ncbi:hypothetical protein LTR94_035920, partial [Friedmanniomyces endolithicus]
RGEGVRPFPGGRRVPAAGGSGRLPAAPGHHRGGRLRRRNGEERDRHRIAAVVRDRRHDPRQPVGRAGGRGARRVRDPEGAGHPQPRRARRQLPELRAPGLRRDPH